jgi:general secretion pathway protein G
MTTTNHRSQKGFTLVELLIVVIILGILAAVVIPQFNSAASESKEAALASNLATVRQAIEMYKVQHNDFYPSAAIVNELVYTTDVSGTTAASGSPYGPYLRNSFPKNPINSLDIVTTGVTTGAASDAAGWIYNTVSGEFRCSSTGAGPSGTPYIDL